MGRSNRSRALPRLAAAAVGILCFGLTPTPALAAPPTAPDRPAKPTVASGDSRIDVTFSTPYNGGSPITGYSADCISSDDGAPGSNTGASPITVGGLDNGSHYTCTVTASNAVGASPPSPASDVVVPATVPDAPPQPAVAAGDARIIVSFGAARDGGSPITSYTAWCASSNGGTSNSYSSPGSPNTVTGLTNGKTYTCTVTATNAIGTGPPSDASATVVPSTVPDAPTIGTVTRGNASGSVAFTPASDNGSPVTSFTASCLSSDGGAPGTRSRPSAPIVVTGLTNAKTYTCRVTATNANGTGAPSSASAAFTPATVPSAPVIGTPEPGNASAAVGFTAGSANGSPITSYTASCTSDNGGASGTQSGSAAPITVAGLTNGAFYRCTVRATNTVGTGAASAASRSFVAGQPAAPTNVRVVPGPAPGATGPLKVLFTPGSGNGSAITSYTASCTSTNGGIAGSQNGTTSPVTVPALTTGKKYACTVVADNARGTSYSSIAGTGVVGAPAAPVVLRVLPIKRGLALPFTAPANNGAPISGYRARCTSADGGTPGSPLQLVSPIVATGLTDGKTYTCIVTANNDRGEGAATNTASVVVGAPHIPNLARCSGNAGTVTASPGLLLSEADPQTFALNTTLGSCSGPYVSSARIVMSFRSERAITCQNAINVNNGGSGTITWTSPLGMGKSSATVRFVITATTGHSTRVHLYGDVTSQANVFTGNHLSGNLTLDKGLNSPASGGDCTVTQRLKAFGVTAAVLTVT